MRQALELALKFVEDSECRTADLEAHIKEALAQPERDYERGFIDGMQKQMQSSVDKAVNRMAQPEQEPVAWMDEDGDVLSASIVDGKGLRNIPLYTNPPQRTWVGLTDEDRLRLWLKTESEDVDRYAFAKAIETKLKEKNT